MVPVPRVPGKGIHFLQNMEVSGRVLILTELIQVSGYGYELITELIEVSGRVWMLYRTHNSIE